MKKSSTMFEKISFRSRVVQLTICISIVLGMTLITGRLIPKLMCAGIGLIVGLTESAIVRRIAKKEETGWNTQMVTFFVLMIFSIVVYAVFTNSADFAATAGCAYIFSWAGKIANDTQEKYEVR